LVEAIAQLLDANMLCDILENHEQSLDGKYNPDQHWFLSTTMCLYGELHSIGGRASEFF